MRELKILGVATLLFGAMACGGKTAEPTPVDDAVVTTDDVQTSDAGADSVDVSDTATGDTAADPNAADKSKILGVNQIEEWQLKGLSAPVQVIRTEGNVAHIYAANRKDLMHAAGFELARDRFFQMELTRRLGLGTLTELLGDAALATDQGSRASGSAFVADNILKRLTPEQKDIFDGFAAGINDYIDQTIAAQGDPTLSAKIPIPSEIAVAGGLLGGTPATLMKKWDTRAVAGAAAAIFYNLGFETDDIGRTATLALLKDAYKGKDLADLRTAGVFADIEYLVKPIKPVSSAAGLGLDYKGKAVTKTERGKVPGGKDLADAKQQQKNWSPKEMPKNAQQLPLLVPLDLAKRAKQKAVERERQSGHDRVNGYGSNAWAVTGTGTTDGRALAAGDGHLPLSVPSLFYQIGLNDSLFGSGDTHTLGMMIPGLPIQAVGTNGHVAWNQTQLVGDITDWYREELTLDANGVPVSTKFQDKQVALSKVDEVYTIADIPALGSKGRVETWSRWVTGDGRWIYEIEGPEVDAKYVAQKGETVVNLGGHLVVPKDTDGDGKVTAVSFDFTGLDNPDLIGAVDGFGHSKDVFELRDWTRHLMGYSQNIAAADTDGHSFYTGYQAVPCRTYLDRDPTTKVWLPGSNPKQLIDGTKYGSFTIPQLASGQVDDTQGADPHKCVVPFDEYPNSIDPPQGYIVTANNDPGNLSTDNNLWNDKWYIGGPWANGYRAGTISGRLETEIAKKTADVAAMSSIQASNQSPTGVEWTPFILSAMDAGAAAAAKATKTPTEQRLADLYNALTPTDLADVKTRLSAWQTAGNPALSGVETFYHTVAAGELDSAVATTIHNAWFGHFVDLVFGDEGQANGAFEPWGGDARTRALSFMKDTRGPGGEKLSAAWNPATQESAFFDNLNTPGVIETSNEIALMALKQGLDAEQQRFGTADHAKWLWGLRHGVHFDSILKEFLGSKPDYAAITQIFSILPDTLPIADNIKAGDPRANLTNFPRGGDGFAVDAAGGINASEYGSGPVFRVVWALGKDKDGKPWIDGANTLPGGQSGLTDSLFFKDQVKLWLANKTMPMRYAPEAVVAGATGREVLKP